MCLYVKGWLLESPKGKTKSDRRNKAGKILTHGTTRKCMRDVYKHSDKDCIYKKGKTRHS